VSLINVYLWHAEILKPFLLFLALFVSLKYRYILTCLQTIYKHAKQSTIIALKTKYGSVEHDLCYFVFYKNRTNYTRWVICIVMFGACDH